MPVQSPFKSDAARDRVLDDYDALLARWPVSYESRFIDTEFGKAHLIASGNPTASPLVLLHGGGGNATMWFHNITALAATFRVYALDIIGDVGRSTGARPAYASGGHVRWLAQVLDGIGLGQTALAGASFGSWLAADFALKHPERVSGLALLAPPHIEPLRLSFMLRAVVATIAPTDSRIRSFYRLISSPHAPQPTGLVMQDFASRAGSRSGRAHRRRQGCQQRICNVCRREPCSCWGKMMRSTTSTKQRRVSAPMLQPAKFRCWHRPDIR
ncbi:hypothetical protein Amn_24990 [Aminobacter sp. Y103A]|nr:hypothetical protein Amn_24990 [Aminobacter sp. SS-2016]